jgi:hypothetical protein
VDDVALPVTCGGVFDRSKDSCVDHVIAYAEPDV